MMAVEQPDNALASAYVRGSEEAFGALVTRHVDLVFATALRQVGDRGVAEEITQNVFLALARKAPGLAGHATLAGWLYRTTILEAKARVRAELRRRNREEISAELAAIQRQGESPSDALIPLLDEGLMTLRENDRLALLLRFFEDRPLREVGARLGVDEDAARKRVSRAIEKLSAFFQERGIASPSGTAALLAAAVTPAPAALASAVTQAAAAGAASGSLMGGLMLHFMAITKTQTVVGCALLAAAPLVWNWRATAAIDEQMTSVQRELRRSELSVEGLSSELAQLEAEAESLNRRREVTEQRLASLQAAANSRRTKEYQWDDQSPLMRIPKRILQGMDLPAFYPGRAQITPNIKLALQMTDNESLMVEGAANRLLMEYHGLQIQRMQAVDANKDELKGRPPEEVRVFQIPALQEEFAALRAAFLAEVDAALGAERAQVFKQSLDNWMPMDDNVAGLNTGLAVVTAGHRAAFYKPEQGGKRIPRRITVENGMMNWWVDADRVPTPFQPYLQDWVSLALTPKPQ